MRRIKGARPSAALIVAVIALVAALGGGAVAGVAVTSLNKKDKKQVRKISKKEANKRIDKREPSLDVNSAKNATNAENAINATNAQNADTAAGVRPVKVDYTGSGGGPDEVLLDEGGIEIRAICSGAPSAQVLLSATAPGGAIAASVIDSPLDTDRVGFETDDEFDPPDDLFFSTAPTNPDMSLTLNYRGTDGTTVTGTLQMRTGTAVADCVISGTLFVG
jgi:hypothetical protein